MFVCVCVCVRFLRLLAIMYYYYVCLCVCRELDKLREGREKQKELMEAISKQRDMYRILLAQSTPIPEEVGILMLINIRAGLDGVLFAYLINFEPLCHTH